MIREDMIDAAARAWLGDFPGGPSAFGAVAYSRFSPGLQLTVHRAGGFEATRESFRRIAAYRDAHGDRAARLNFSAHFR